MRVIDKSVTESVSESRGVQSNTVVYWRSIGGAPVVGYIYNCTKIVKIQPFWAADFASYDFIFGYLWLAEADPKIHFKTRIFK